MNKTTHTLTNSELLDKLNKLNACKSSIEWLESRTSEEMWNDCPRGDWMLWLLSSLKLDKRRLTLCKGKCAETVKHLMEDNRSINAVEVAIRYGHNEATEEELTAAAADAAAYADAACAAAAYAAATAAYAAAYADAAAAAAYAADAADVAAYADAAYAAAAAARKQNQRQTADIIRSIISHDELLILLCDED